MTVPPPEPPSGGEPPARRSSEPTDSEVDASFAALVAGWGDVGPAWPQVPEPEPVVTPAPPPQQPEPVVDLGPDANEDEGHFEPPEPPPVPSLHRATVGAIVLIAIGVFLLLAPGVIGLAGSTGYTLGLLSITGGLAWLLSRLRPGPPHDSGWDDGAQL